MAKRLTFPQPVAPYNLQKMKELVINGKDEHPGANMIEDENGSRIMLEKMDLTQRKA